MLGIVDFGVFRLTATWFRLVPWMQASQAFELALEKSFEASPSYNLPSINAAEREEKIVSGSLSQNYPLLFKCF
jgi:hypothetical protein